MMIPKSLAENNKSGPISVFGHGLFGDSDSYVKNGRAIANEYQTVLLVQISKDGVLMGTRML